MKAVFFNNSLEVNLGTLQSADDKNLGSPEKSPPQSAQLSHRWKETACDTTSRMSQVKVLAEPKLQIVTVQGKRQEF